MQIQCLISKNSWVDKNYQKLIRIKLSNFSKKIFFFDSHKKLKEKFDINLIFSYFKKVPKKYLDYSKFNLVIHGSNLPYGKGMSPISWQILQGENRIVFTLFEANENFDEGKYYLKKNVNFGKTSLLKKIKEIQFREMLNIYVKFLNNMKKIKLKEQKGASTYFRYRTPNDSMIDVNKSIKDQFNLLRVVDNENYPAFFIYKNKRFKIQIIEDDKNSSK